MLIKQNANCFFFSLSAVLFSDPVRHQRVYWVTL